MNSGTKRFLLMVLGLCSCLVAETISPDQEVINKLHINFEKYALPNGLEVILSPNPSPFVAVNIWYHVGSEYEQHKLSGLAHLFEHLMFEGSAFAKGNEHFKLLEGAGGFAMNASTSFSQTNYYETVPKSQLELALALESSRMYFLDLNQSRLDEQRAVVKREREQRYEITPYGNASLLLWDTVFPKNNPLHGRVIGSHADLTRATLKDIERFYIAHYGPSNATLTLVGGFDVAQAKKLIEKYFASLPKTKTIAPPTMPKMEITKQEIIHYQERLGKLPLVRVYYITPALFAEGDADLDIIAHVLAGGEYGRLTKALKRDKAMAVSVSASQGSMRSLSIFSIDMILNPGVKPEDALGEMDKVIHGLKTNPPTPTEIERARNSIVTDNIFALQQEGGPNGRAEILQTYNLFAHDPGFLPKDVARFFKVTPESAVRAVETYLKKDRRVILFAIPDSIAKKGQ